MQLILGTQTELERIHKGDEILCASRDQATAMGRQSEWAHLRRFGHPLASLDTRLARMLDRCWNTHFESVQRGWIVHPTDTGRPDEKNS